MRTLERMKQLLGKCAVVPAFRVVCVSEHGEFVDAHYYAMVKFIVLKSLTETY